MRACSIIAAALILAACAAHQPGGLGEPTLLTNPKQYLETVGLGNHTKDDVLNTLGAPDRQFEHDGRDMWTYMLSEEGAKRRFTYIFEDKTLYDVRYEESGGIAAGPYDGMTAREAQAK